MTDEGVAAGAAMCGCVSQGGTTTIVYVLVLALHLINGSSPAFWAAITCSLGDFTMRGVAELDSRFVRIMCFFAVHVKDFGGNVRCTTGNTHSCSELDVVKGLA